MAFACRPLLFAAFVAGLLIAYGTYFSVSEGQARLTRPRAGA